MITPTGAVAISVYRATESIRFAGSVGALSQSPDSYRPVQKMNSLTRSPTMRRVRVATLALLKVRVALAGAEASRLSPYEMHRQHHSTRQRMPVRLSALRH